MSLSNVIDYNLYYCPIIKKNLYYCPCMISYSDDGQGLYFFFVFLENLFYWSIFFCINFIDQLSAVKWKAINVIMWIDMWFRKCTRRMEIVHIQYTHFFQWG